MTTVQPPPRKRGAKPGTKLSPQHKEKIREGARRFWDKIKKLQDAAEAQGHEAA